MVKNEIRKNETRKGTHSIRFLIQYKFNKKKREKVGGIHVPILPRGQEYKYLNLLILFIFLIQFKYNNGAVMFLTIGRDKAKQVRNKIFCHPRISLLFVTPKIKNQKKNENIVN